MKELSYWASKHILAARLFMAMAFILLAASSIIIGLYWAYTEVYFPAIPIYFLILAGLTIGIIKYPTRSQIKDEINFGKEYFRAWKFYDLNIVIPMFLIALSIGHGIPTKDASTYPIYWVAGQLSTVDPGLKVLKLENNSTHLKGRIFRGINKINQLIKEKIFKFFERIEEKGSGWIWVFIVLLVIVILFAQYLLAALACSLACSGYVAASYLVFFGGSGILFFLLFHVSRSLFRRQAKKENKPEDKKSLNKKAWRVIGVLALLEGLLLIILGLFNN